MLSKFLAVTLPVLAIVGSATELAPCAHHSDCGPAEQCFLAQGNAVKLESVQGICTRKSLSDLTAATSFIEVEEAKKVDETQNVAGNGELRLAAALGRAATVHLGRDPKLSYFIGVDGDGEFAVRQGTEEGAFLSIKENEVKTNTKVLKAKKVNAKDGYRVGKVLQWGMEVSDTFSASNKGNKNSTRGWIAETPSIEMDLTTCGGVTMLGGPGLFTTGEISKTYTGLRKHTAVRVVATFHMIDLWMGEYAYMTLSTGAVNGNGIDQPEYVWTKSYSAAASSSTKASGLNVCGDEQVVEMEFTAAIDVSARHSKDTLKVSFGTKLGKNADTNLGGASWGVSRVDLFLKSEE